MVLRDGGNVMICAVVWTGHLYVNELISRAGAIDGSFSRLIFAAVR